MGLSRQSIKCGDILPQLNAIRQLANGHVNQSVLNVAVQQILEMLLDAEIKLQGLMPWSSNYTFLVNLISKTNQANLVGVYKPCSGERPLWDFPDGSLCYREFASYLISQVLSWPNIPPTVLRDGPHGQGSVQLFIEAEYEAHYFNMRHNPTFTEEFKRVALFDFIVNNADRKGGHCLKGKDGQLWAIDHGLTFHTDFKLRTVIWEFCTEVIPEPLLKDLERLQDLLQSSQFCHILTQFMSVAEIQAFKERVEFLVSTECFPELHPRRNVPYPPI